MNHTYRIYSVFIFLTSLSLFSCNRSIKGEDYEAAILQQLGLRNHEFDSVFVELLPQINALVKESGSKIEIKLSKDFHYENKNEILVIPITAFAKKISASSNLEYRFILINPEYINSIIYEIMLDGNVFREIAAVLLMHEFCHFELGKPGLFDEIVSTAINNDSENISYRNSSFNEEKILELKVDSLAVNYLKIGSESKNETCSLFSNLIIKQLRILEATVAIERITNFYDTEDFLFLNDLSKSHPNFELRLAFMNYYLNPSDAKKRMLDRFIEVREIKLQ